MTNAAGDQPPKPRLSPTALSVADAALLLTKLGGDPISEKMIEADIAAGAPRNIDGSMNLVHYAAWLVREMSQRGD